jgi:hypothetical protein
MNITFPAAFADGDTLTAAKLNALVTAITGYSVAVTDLANQYAAFTVPITASSIAAGATFVARMKIPAGETWSTTQAELSYQSSGGATTVTFQFSTNQSGSPVNVLSTAATVSSTGTTSTVQTNVIVSSLAGSAELVFTLSNTGANTATNVTGVVHFKCKHVA